MKVIVIAGATGFIGRWFIHQYSKTFKIIALSRSEVQSATYPEVEWRKVDLYSLSSTTNALDGADYALYLVHSMQPSTRLNQGSFQDTDLLLADNFSRAAEACRLKRIVFVGGILPKDSTTFSTHLRSRYETERTLGSRAVPLTAIRAGIIIGPGGSSFEIVQKLVARLPIMACPKWCTSPSQPIDIEDMLRVMVQAFDSEAEGNLELEVGGPDILTYMDLLRHSATIMGKRRIIFSLPFFTLGFSKLWVALFSNSSRTFVSPLVESLKHDMRIKPELETKGIQMKIGVLQSIEKAIKNTPPQLDREQERREEKNTVRSVQRLGNPANKSVQWVADAYPKWVPTLFSFFIKAKEIDGELFFKLMGFTLLILRYVDERSDTKRRLFYIVGGGLTKRGDHGWLEFRSVLDNQYVIAAIHEFVPSLPWSIYRYTQAVAHLFVMKQFDKYLQKQKNEEAP